MFTAKINGYDGAILATKRFRSQARMEDYLADVMGSDEHAKDVDIERDGRIVGHVDFDELRDRALLNGYILPVHRKMERAS